MAAFLVFIARNHCNKTLQHTHQWNLRSPNAVHALQTVTSDMQTYGPVRFCWPGETGDGRVRKHSTRYISCIESLETCTKRGFSKPCAPQMDANRATFRREQQPEARSGQR
jgi:hypothetical protein